MIFVSGMKFNVSNVKQNLSPIVVAVGCIAPPTKKFYTIKRDSFVTNFYLHRFYPRIAVFHDLK